MRILHLKILNTFLCYFFHNFCPSPFLNCSPMPCYLVVSLGLQAVGGRCELLCKYSVVVHRNVVCQETDRCRTELPVNAISKVWSLFWGCPLPKCHCSCPPVLFILPALQSFSLVELFPVDMPIKMFSIAICNRSVCFGNCWSFPVKY